MASAWPMSSHSIWENEGVSPEAHLRFGMSVAFTFVQ